MNTLDPERRTFCRLTFDSNNGILLGVHPDSAPGEILVLSFRLDLHYVRRAAPNEFGLHHLECVVVWIDAGPLAHAWPRGVGLAFEQPRENVLSRSAPSSAGDDFELLRAIFPASATNQHLGSLVKTGILQQIAPARSITAEYSLPCSLAHHHSGDHFAGSESCRRGIIGWGNDRCNYKKRTRYHAHSTQDYWEMGGPAATAMVIAIHGQTRI